MKTAKNTAYLVGYELTESHDGGRAVEGSAFLNGERFIHALSLDNVDGQPIDLGRSDDGELVWVSAVGITPAQALEARFDSVFLPPAQYAPHPTLAEPNHVKDADVDELGPLHSLLKVLRGHRRIVAVALIAGVAGLSIFLMIPAPGQETPEAEQLVTSHVTQQLSEEGMTAEEAAMNFVYSGEANIPQLPSGLALEDLTAVVVSSSGELVLVEVAHQNASTYTKFATLLLQKTEATWRIREVFDTEEY